MKKILILVDNNERLEFFRRRVRELNEFEFYFAHSNVYTYIKSCVSNIEGNHFILKRNGFSCDIDCIELNKSDFSSVPVLDEKKIPLFDFDLLWVFNGFQSAAVQLIEKFSNLNKMYFEIGNFPNKFQCNKNGINADSVFDINKYPSVDPIDVIDEITGYVPPHINKSIIKQSIEYIVNYIGYYLFFTLAPRISPMRAILKAISIKKIRCIIKKYKNIEYPDRYHLFVGQVLEDSQIVYQSSETNISALKKWYEDFKGSGIPLVYRFHPAEKNIDSVLSIKKFCRAKGILISNCGNIEESFRGACSISMINSTSGLYAILNGHAVKLYGRSFFNGWSKEDVAKYYRYVLREDRSS